MRKAMLRAADPFIGTWKVNAAKAIARARTIPLPGFSGRAWEPGRN